MISKNLPQIIGSSNNVFLFVTFHGTCTGIIIPLSL